MKFNVGDLCFYTSTVETEPSIIDFGGPGNYVSFRVKYLRPFYMLEAQNAGIILECHKSSDFFKRTNKKYNTYVWQSQQTGKEWAVFECELTSADEYSKFKSYSQSFISPLSRKK